MARLLLFGAGKSATVLIDYLVVQCARREYALEVVDAQPDVAKEKILDSCRLQGIDPAPFSGLSYDIHSSSERQESIKRADLVISLLPPHLHSIVAADCLQFGRSLFTASYIDPVIQNSATDIQNKGLLFLYEMGLDPGIDHMSLMALLSSIRSQGGVPVQIRSHCGGLVAPESDDNPWHYKISWNPRNVVMAGKTGAQYLENGRLIQKDHAQLFSEQRILHVDQVGDFAYYPNRDSLGYIGLYGLQGIESFQRTTLRHPVFMRGWSTLIRLGMMDESREISVTPYTCLADAMTQCAHLPKELPVDIRSMLNWLGWTDYHTILPFRTATPASILQFAMEKKWVLKPDDKDQIVLVHEMDYRIGSETKHLMSWLIDTGINSLRTAMARTVGLPIGIAAIQYLDGRWRATGLQIPTLPDIYRPVLQELKEFGIVFHETTR